MYLISVLLFMLIMPAAFISGEHLMNHIPVDIPLCGKWFLFWAVGVRLFVAGFRQVTKPAFTAKQIFHIDDEGSFPIIRELGFANISLGLIAILSLYEQTWRLPAAIAGGLYFGLAGLMHLFKKADSRNEIIAMVSDFFIFLMMAAFVFMPES